MKQIRLEKLFWGLWSVHTQTWGQARPLKDSLWETKFGYTKLETIFESVRVGGKFCTVHKQHAIFTVL